MINTKSIASVSDVVKHGFCVGCGACAHVDAGIYMYENRFGAYEPSLDGSIEPALAAKVCPFTSVSENETQLAKHLFNDCTNQDDLLGSYNGVYASYVKEPGYRDQGSSGGLASWLSITLMQLGKIDCVIHVKSTWSKDTLFEYRISDNVDDVREGAKTKYYPVHFEQALAELIQTDRRALIIGVPCFIKAIRNLCLQDAKLNDNIVYTASLVCGHLKSKSFSKYLALNAGANPRDVVNIDFRQAMPERDAHDYGIKVSYEKSDGNRKEKIAGPVKGFLGEDWGIGLFKLGSCEFCDDIAGEVADITIGDAWIPPYEQDCRGTNIVICRSAEIEDLLQDAARKDLLLLDSLKGEDFVYSQAGSYRHRREGLAYRMQWYAEQGKPFPTKRIIRLKKQLGAKEQRSYKLRHKLATMSHSVFRLSTRVPSIVLFNLAIFFPIKRYYANQSSWLRALVPAFIKLAFKQRMWTHAGSLESRRKSYIKNHEIE